MTTSNCAFSRMSAPLARALGRLRRRQAAPSLAPLDGVLIDQPEMRNATNQTAEQCIRRRKAPPNHVPERTSAQPPHPCGSWAGGRSARRYMARGHTRNHRSLLLCKAARTMVPLSNGVKGGAEQWQSLLCRWPKRRWHRLKASVLRKLNNG